MTNSEIIKSRLINQQIAETKFKNPQEIVAWMIAMQAQEYAMAKWAIGLRLPGLKNADVEKAFNDGDILRTHLMRPTWHFVTPADIRWMLALTAPRVNAANAYSYRKFELDSEVLKCCNNTLIKALQGGKHLTRIILKSALEQEGIIADGLRLSYIMMHAELDAIICSGARQGKQFTYALLEERVPPVKAMEREEALAEFTRRYFTSRGPATLRDFSTWSGLTMKDVKAGLDMVRPHFASEIIQDQEYIFMPNKSKDQNEIQSTFLMPDYDEYGMSYKDRSAILNTGNTILESQDGNTPSYHMIVIEGMIKGTWRHTIKTKSVAVETNLFTILSEKENRSLEIAVKRYKEFME
jgi:hypothetical protein